MMKHCPHFIGAPDAIDGYAPEADAIQRNAPNRRLSLKPECPLCNPARNRQERRAIAKLRWRLERAGSSLASQLKS